MNVVRLLLVTLFFTINTYSSECGLTDSIASVCSKNKRVKSLAELNTYLSRYAEKDGVYRNLVIDFDLNSDVDLNIHSPCKIVFKRLKGLKA